MRIRPLFKLLRLAPLAAAAYFIYQEVQRRQAEWAKTPSSGPSSSPSEPPAEPETEAPPSEE